MSILLAVLAALANVAGALLAAFLSRSLNVWVAFATGFLLATSLVDMVPASLEAGSTAPLWILAGYLGLYLLESTTEPHHGVLDVDTAGVTPASQLSGVAVLGLAVHTFMAGAAIVAGAAVSRRLALEITGAVALHKLPEGAAVVALMRSAGYDRRRSVAAAAVVGLTTVAGALVVGWTEPLALAMLPVATGATLYVAATQLLPTLAHAVDPRARVAFLVGAVLYAAVTFVA